MISIKWCKINSVQLSVLPLINASDSYLRTLDISFTYRKKLGHNRKSEKAISNSCVFVFFFKYKFIVKYELNLGICKFISVIVISIDSLITNSAVLNPCAQIN